MYIPYCDSENHTLVQVVTLYFYLNFPFFFFFCSEIASYLLSLGPDVSHIQESEEEAAMTGTVGTKVVWLRHHQRTAWPLKTGGRPSMVCRKLF